VPNAGLEIYGDTTALHEDLKKATAEFRRFNENAIKAATGVKAIEDKAKPAAGSIAALKTQATALSKSLDNLAPGTQRFISTARKLSEVEQKLKDVRSAAQGVEKTGFFSTGAGKIAGAVGAGFLGAAGVQRAIAFFKDWGGAILSSSSAMQELDSKARVVFGQTFPQVETRVKAIAEEVGRADSAILQYAADLGAVIDAAGLTKEATAGMSTEFAKLAVDLASFHNTSDIEAFNALRSAITGELEPMKRFGVVMTQANLAAFALEKGISKKIETMNQAQLTALRYNYLLARTETAQGDAARTAESYANQQRRLTGEITELNEQLGKSATPALASGLALLNGALQNTRIFVGLLIQDIQRLLSVLGVTNIGGAIASTVKSGVNGLIDTALGPVTGPALRAGAARAFGAFGQRIEAEKNKPQFTRPDFNVPTQYEATGVKTLQEMMKEYEGTGAKAGGGASAAKEQEKLLNDIVKAQEDILKALSEEAKLNLENIRSRKEDLELRQKLGVLTKREEEELRRINGRLEFAGEAMDDLVDKWEDQQDAIEASAKKLADLRAELKGLQDDLAANLKEIDADNAEARLRKITELLKEQNEIRAKYTPGAGLSGDDSFRIGEIDSQLAGASPAELAEAQRLSGLTDLQLSDEEAAQKKQALIDEEKQKRDDLLRQIDEERDRLDVLKSQAVETQRAIVDALNDRYTQTQITNRLIEEDTRTHVQAQIDELDKLERKYRSLGMTPGSLNPSGVTNTSTQTNNVNVNNYGDAARVNADPKLISWNLKKVT
jgi:hypothetical protein